MPTRRRGDRISEHEVRFFRAVGAGSWLTSRQLAEEAGIAERTTRAYLTKGVREGLIERMAVWPAARYRLAPDAAERDPDYFQRLAAASTVLLSE